MSFPPRRVPCGGNGSQLESIVKYRHRQSWVSSMRDVRKRVVAASHGCPRDSADPLVPSPGTTGTMGSDRVHAAPGRHVASGVNVPLAWAMFGGSTLLLFLLCYCCQKKIQEDNLTLAAHRHSAETSREPLTALAAVESPISGDHMIGGVPPIVIVPPPSPPPTYDSVVKKQVMPPLIPPPPPYEVAVANLQSSGFV